MICPRTVMISMDDNMKYRISFLNDKKVKWTIDSYSLTSKLNEIIFEWIDKEIHPPYGYT
jgi:hypothetical protein